MSDAFRKKVLTDPTTQDRAMADHLANQARTDHGSHDGWRESRDSGQTKPPKVRIKIEYALFQFVPSSSVVLLRKPKLWMEIIGPRTRWEKPGAAISTWRIRNVATTTWFKNFAASSQSCSECQSPLPIFPSPYSIPFFSLPHTIPDLIFSVQRDHPERRSCSPRRQRHPRRH